MSQYRRLFIDFDSFSDYIYEDKYQLPDRISFGDPGRMFDE